MDEENLYDEFGNYIGPEMDVSEDESGDSDSQDSNKQSSYAYEKSNGEEVPGGGPAMQAQDQGSSAAVSPNH